MKVDSHEPGITLALEAEPPRNFTHKGFHTLYYDPNHPHAVIRSWLNSKSSQCNREFTGYGKEVALAML